MTQLKIAITVCVILIGLYKKISHLKRVRESVAVKQEIVTHDGKQYFVSTIWSEPDSRYETMVFAKDEWRDVYNWCEIYGRRYSSYVQAVAGHVYVIEKLLSNTLWDEREDK